ncbi:ATP-dependent zinc metalloprotease FtsH [Candidatus Jidaibacter acanthamoeba]|uniref:ATP-dependent zinc metalloprotease FtsH n=2 Tax=Candidatus Jidaibacter acanthamoebae TaxID=86105 RepID=A0A0C1QPI6_9RICK|nr:ATP-dependent zinc metalloprotease FtsH [Candidatus Jidaibacter acanthamoeba]
MNKFMKGNTGKNFAAWAAIILLTVFVYELIGEFAFSSTKIPFSDFLNNVKSGNVAEVTIRGSSIEGKLSDGKVFNTLVPIYYPRVIDELTARNIKIDVVPTESSINSLFGILLSWFPVLLLLGVWIYFMRNMQSGTGKAMGFGKSKAKLMMDSKNKVTFAEVAGVDEAKEELQEIVEFLKFPAKFQRLGGKIPKGCLLIGSPGTGKTLLAKAIAGEAGVPFFSISGSDFVEMFVGVGASRVRDMFKQAHQHAPCIVFIDEIDAMGRQRGAGLGGGNDEREQTLNQLLVEMDGFKENEGVIVIAATNRPDVLDPALLRPGRFDRQITVPVPDINGREQIIKVHIKKVPAAPDVNIRTIARGTPGFAGADLANIVNEAAILAARKNMNVVTMHEFEEARDKVMMGVERKSIVMREEERKLTAYHEGGHALVTVYSEASDPIHKATIIPRGRALGLVMRLPEEDRFSATREKLLADIVVSMGGRVAEEIIFGKDKITSGASSDIKSATSIARKMVTQWGLSDEIGPVLVGDDRDEVFLGQSLGHQTHISNELACKIDAEIKRIITECYNQAHHILTKHLDQLHLLAAKLLEYETLTGEEIKDLIAGKDIKINDSTDSKNDSGSKPQKSSSVPSTNHKGKIDDKPIEA